MTADTRRISRGSPKIPADRLFTGFAHLLLWELELNGWRRPEPQTRGETCQRVSNWVMLDGSPRFGLVFGNLENQNLDRGRFEQGLRRVVVGLGERFQFRGTHSRAMTCRVTDHVIAVRWKGGEEGIIKK